MKAGVSCLERLLCALCPPLPPSFLQALDAVPSDAWPAVPLPERVALFAFPTGMRISAAPACPPPSVLHFCLVNADAAKLYCTALIQWRLLGPEEAASIIEVRHGNGGNVDIRGKGNG
jgi:hypothetical protein